MESLKNLHRLPPAHTQLIIVPCHEVVDNHSELAASRQLSDQEMGKKTCVILYSSGKSR